MRLLVYLPGESWRNCFRRGRWRDFVLRLIPPSFPRFTSLVAKVWFLFEMAIDPDMVDDYCYRWCQPGWMTMPITVSRIMVCLKYSKTIFYISYPPGEHFAFWGAFTSLGGGDLLPPDGRICYICHVLAFGSLGIILSNPCQVVKNVCASPNREVYSYSICR